MNKQGKGMNVVLKVLLIVVGLITIFSGANNLWISTGRESLIRVFSLNVALTMKILYVVTGVGSIITSIALIIKAFRK